MKRLALLDYGRFFAVIIVVLFHYTFNGIANGKISSISHIPSVIAFTKYGYLGVELFFMISGYVIFFSARNATAAKFAVSRSLRLYPAYWFAVLFTSLFALHYGGDLMSVNLAQILANLSMLQYYLGIQHVDGVYWTLVYEITFYAAVFFLLFCGFREKLNSIFICWPILFFIGILLKIQHMPFMGNYYYYFCAGALFAILKERFTWPAMLSLLVSYVCCIVFSTGNAGLLTQSKGIEFSPVVIGVAISLFFILFACQNLPKAQSLRLPFSEIAGALTYPIYLIHAHFGYMLISKFATEENKVLMYVMTFSLVLAIAFFIHKVIEVRFAHVWKNLFISTVGRFVDFLQGISSGIRIAYINRTSTRIE